MLVRSLRHQRMLLKNQQRLALSAQHVVQQTCNALGRVMFAATAVRQAVAHKHIGCLRALKRFGYI